MSRKERRLSPQRAAVVGQLLGGPATVPQLANATKVNRAVVYRSIAQLEAKGLIAKEWVTGETGRAVAQYHVVPGEEDGLRARLVEFEKAEAHRGAGQRIDPRGLGLEGA